MYQEITSGHWSESASVPRAPKFYSGITIHLHLQITSLDELITAGMRGQLNFNHRNTFGTSFNSGFKLGTGQSQSYFRVLLDKVFVVIGCIYDYEYARIDTYTLVFSKRYKHVSSSNWFGFCQLSRHRAIFSAVVSFCFVDLRPDVSLFFEIFYELYAFLKFAFFIYFLTLWRIFEDRDGYFLDSDGSRSQMGCVCASS